MAGKRFDVQKSDDAVLFGEAVHEARGARYVTCAFSLLPLSRAVFHHHGCGLFEA